MRIRIISERNESLHTYGDKSKFPFEYKADDASCYNCGDTLYNPKNTVMFVTFNDTGLKS